ncbi:MAG: VOC family protein [Proteobacteria bacterium]|nr:VOC family protein [Pseudomonadota bacterium]
MLRKTKHSGLRTEREEALGSPRREGVTSIHSLDRFVFSVPDLSMAKAYYSAFGLDLREIGGRLDLHTHGHPHRWGSVYASGKPKKLEYLAFGVYAEDFEPLRRHLEKKGGTFIHPHKLADTEGYWLSDPDGIALQIVVAEKSSPSKKTDSVGPLKARTSRGTVVGPSRSGAQPVKPVRLTHALLYSTDVPRSVRFYSEMLGLRLSDQSGDGIAFLHGAHSSDHHLLAFVKSSGPGLHHTSWIVGSVDEIGLGMEQMRAAGYPNGWGVGRHVLGSNYFFYSEDPWGSFTEFSCDIDFIGAESEWPHADHPPNDSFYLWGPDPPGNFITNHEAGEKPPP